MKIGIVSTYTNCTPPLGYGGECYYWSLAKGLANKGHEVHLFAASGSECPPNGFVHYTYRSPDGLVDYQVEDWIVRKYKDILLSMDVVHDCSLDHIVAEQLRHLYGFNPIVNTINGTTYYMPRPPFNVVTGSKFWQNDAKSVGLNTEMIYWGSDCEFYIPEYEKGDYLLWIARFHPSKGLDLALDLAEMLGFKLVVAGSMQFADHEKHGREYLKRIASISNVEYVSLPQDHTHHVAKRELMQKARAFLYPVDYKECFGMVVTESMACGTPVITTSKGAMPEIVDHEVNGFICEGKRDFAKAIMERLPYFEEHKKYHNGFDLWKAAREKAEQFDVSKAVNAYENLYREVIGGKSW